MSKILAIDTATEACSAALFLGDRVLEKRIISRFQFAPREHTKLILPMMDEVLEEAGIALKDIDAVAFSRGPGAFTGLRIAAGVAQGIALSVDKPVITVSTLKALALQAAKTFTEKKGLIISVLDARMGEVYWCIYQYKLGELNQLVDEAVSKPEEMLVKVAEITQTSDESANVIAIGSGWEVYVTDKSADASLAPMLDIPFLKNKLPDATEIVELAAKLFDESETVLPEDAQPIYLRNNVAKKPKK